MADPSDQPAPLTSKQIELLRYQARLDLWKVVAGTMIVGVAVAFFPFAQKYAEVYFQARIEQIKADSSKEILDKTNQLEKDKIAYQADKDRAEAQRVEGVALRLFLNDLGTEGRSADIEARIRLAEYFSFVLPSTEQSSDWVGFRNYLLDQRVEQLTRRRAALKIQLDPKSSDLERALAAADVVEIDRTLTPSRSAGTASKTEVPYESLGIDRKTINGDLKVAGTAFLLDLFGPPAREIDQGGCQFPDTEPLKSQMVSVTVGKTPALLAKPAAMSISDVLMNFAEQNPELAAQLESLGGWCIRYKRGSGNLSDHSFGIAIDISIGGVIDTMGNNSVSPSLAALAPFFIEAGWYWGAGFARDEPMHFEASRQLVERWVSEGKLLTLKPSKSE